MHGADDDRAQGLEGEVSEQEVCAECKRDVIRRLLTRDEMVEHWSGKRKLCVCGFRRFVDKVVGESRPHDAVVWPGYEERTPTPGGRARDEGET
jgi:hypothetical protein